MGTPIVPPIIALNNLDIPKISNLKVTSKRRQTNEGSALIDFQLLAVTDKIMHTERDVSKVELSVNDSDNSSFRQSQYGGRDEIPVISTEFTGGDKP